MTKVNSDDMSDTRQGHRQWLSALCGIVLSLCLPSGLTLAQTGVGWLPRSSGDAQGLQARAFSVPPAAGAVIVRGRYKSEALASLQSAARVFSSNDKLDIAFDDYASLGRFCDRDEPFHVLVQEGVTTRSEKLCRQWRFPADTHQPDEFPLGVFRVVLIVNKSNPIRSLDLSGICRSLCGQGKAVKWQNVGGSGVATVRCYGVPKKTWARRLIQEKCMASWQDSSRPSGCELKGLGFRDDLVVCETAEEVLKKVRRDRNGLGFFAFGGELTERDLQGVKVLPVAAKEGGEAVAPTLESVIDRTYPLSEPVFLYVHPNAPKEAWEFCKFATGPEAAKIVKESGLWPEYDLEQICGKQRLAELRKGKGSTIRVCDLTGSEPVLNDVAAKFVKAKAAARLMVQKGNVQDVAIHGFFKDGTELLLMDRPLSEVTSKKTGVTSALSQKESENSEGNSRFSSVPSPTARSIVLGRMAVGVIVHPKNVLDSLPLDELRGILCREITQWPAANGVAGTMRVHGLKHDDPITELLKEKLGETRGEGLNYRVEPDTTSVVLAVAKNPFAIGIVDLSRLASDEKAVKLVNIYLPGRPAEGQTSTKDAKSGKQASPSTSAGPHVLSNDYPLARTFTLYVSSSASQIAKDFAEFAASPHCAETLVQHHLIPQQHASLREAGGAATTRELQQKPSQPYLRRGR